MAIGTGVIVSAFKEYKKNENYVIFASGVSNASIINPSKTMVYNQI